MEPSSAERPEKINSRRLAEITGKHGEWTAHRIHLGDGIYTIPEVEKADVHPLRRVLQVVADNASKPFNELRILDLACLEGGYSIEMALHGATVVGIEGRDINIEKARYAQQALRLENVEFFQDDVRNLSVETYGTFDVVLVLGILYHLDTPDVFHLMKRVNEVCRGFAIVDTLTSTYARTSIEHQGKTYWGHRWAEFPEGTTESGKSKFAWASLDNDMSFCFTVPSLLNMILDAGFTSVYEVKHPSDLTNYQDRFTMLARKGTPASLLSQPDRSNLPVREWPEKEARSIGAPFNKEPEEEKKKRSFWRRG